MIGLVHASSRLTLMLMASPTFSSPVGLVIGLVAVLVGGGASLLHAAAATTRMSPNVVTRDVDRACMRPLRAGWGSSGASRTGAESSSTSLTREDETTRPTLVTRAGIVVPAEIKGTAAEPAPWETAQPTSDIATGEWLRAPGVWKSNRSHC